VDGFLETTAMVDLIFKDKTARNRVQSVLSSYQTTYTSQYVRMEIKRGVLQYYVALYNKSIECKNLTEVIEYIQTISYTPQRNRLGALFGALTMSYERIARRSVGVGAPANQITTIQKKLFEGILRAKIKQFWASFAKQVNVVLDPAECYKHKYTLKPPVMTPEGRFDNALENCDKYKSGICRVRQLLNGNQAGVAAIIKTLNALPDPDAETQKRRRALKEVMRLKNRDVPRRECWHSGDAVIALESPAGAEIVTHNCKHFTPLCQALGKPLRCY